MQPLSIALAIETRELWDEAQACIRPLSARIIIEQRDAADLGPFFERVQRMRPEVLLLDISRLKQPIEETVRLARASAPDAMIIALNTVVDAETVLAALRAGVNEYLYPPLQGNLRKALEKRAQECRNRDGHRDGGKTLGFFSVKGGCGATTLAVHVAVELGRYDRKVLLADMDLDSGLISFLLKTKSPYSILDAFNNVHRLDMSYWRALVSNGIPNLEVIPAPGPLSHKQPVSQEQLHTVLNFVRTQYDCTVVDLGRSLNRMTMDALEDSSDACLVTTLEIPALHQAKQIVQKLLDGGYNKNRLRLIVNRVPKRMDITADELEKMLGVPVYCMLPDEYSDLYECYAEGRLMPRNAPFGKHITRLAMRLAGIEEDSGAKKRFSLFG